MSLSTDRNMPNEPTADQPRLRIAIYRDWILLVSIAVVIGLDQLTKHLVRDNMSLGQSIPVDGFFRLTYHTNSGTIFGLLPNATMLLTIISVFAIMFLAYFYSKQKTLTPVLRLSIGLLLGGAFGNLIDRVAMGRVTDFIDVGIWPIFNIADSSITVGIFLLIVFMSLSSGKKHKSDKSRDSALASKHCDHAD